MPLFISGDIQHDLKQNESGPKDTVQDPTQLSWHVQSVTWLELD